jgi:release factor glutamine methyltransferase
MDSNEKLSGKLTSTINGFSIVTDLVEYCGEDQVFPLHPENQFYLDEIALDKVRGANVLEIGIGSGVLSIGVVRAGASHVTALEINPRAKNFAGFNILMNGAEDAISIGDGVIGNVFKPVEGKQFDYIISNPPFEPTPPGTDYYLHSSGGMYGLDVVEDIFKNLNNYLTGSGHAQIVTFSPGNAGGPFMLVDMIEKYLPGKTKINVNPVSMKFDDFVDRFVDIEKATKRQVVEIKEQASLDGVTHLYLCMVHYERGEKSLVVGPSTKTYRNWDLPLNSNVLMGMKER